MKKLELTLWELSALQSMLSQLGNVQANPFGGTRINYKDVYRIGKLGDELLVLSKQQLSTVNAEERPDGSYALILPGQLRTAPPEDVREWTEKRWDRTFEVELPTKLFDYLVKKVEGYGGWSTDPMTRRRLPALLEKLEITFEEEED